MTVIFERKAKPAHRYQVQRSQYGWTTDGESYRTWIGARYQVWIWNTLGFDARIIDTRQTSASQRPTDE